MPTLPFSSRRFFCLTLVFSLCFMVGLSGCTRRKTESNTLHIRIGGEPPLLNPLLSKDTTAATVERFIFSGLLKTTDDLTLIPDLAERYTVSPDGKTYTFYLKKNAKWHDGHPFSANDVAFTIAKILDPKTITVRRSDFQINGKAIRVVVLDPYRIQFILPEIFAPFLSNLTIGVLPKHLLTGKDINTTTFNHRPVGTGPYKLAQWKPSQYLQLVRHDAYYGSRPKTPQILIKIIPDNTGSRVAFEKKELHLLGIEPHDKNRLQTRRDLHIVTYDALAYTYMSFNLKNPLFSDVRVRRALTHAVNKEALVTHVLHGFGRPAYWPDAPASWAYPGEDKPLGLGYDPTKAKRLLSEAGWILNPKTHILEKNGHPFSFTVILGKGQSDREKTAQIIQQFFRQVGIDMHIQLMEWSSLVKRISSPQDPKPFEAALLGWMLNADPDCYSIWHSHEYPNGFNLVGYHNPEVDRDLVLARQTLDSKARKRLYTTIYTRIAQDAPYLFLYYPKAISGVYNTVKGLSKPGPAGLLNTVESVYLQ